MIYRKHRRTLAESLGTTVEFNNIDEMFKYIKEYYDVIPVVDIKLEYIGYDPRCGWDYHYVMVRLENDADGRYGVAGMCDLNKKLTQREREDYRRMGCTEYP